MNRAQASSFSNKNGRRTFADAWLPYCFKQVDVSDTPYVFIPLNGSMKPLGHRDLAPIDLTDFAPTRAVKFSKHPSKIDGAWWGETDGTIDTFFLYDHSIESKLDYFSRLEAVLLKATLLNRISVY